MTVTGYEIKCVTVGEGKVGKTCLLMSYTQNKFQHNYHPTIIDNYKVNVFVSEKLFTLNLYDTAGREEFSRMRQLAYYQTDIFLICFAVSSPESFAKIKQRWINEVWRNIGGAVYILVGTKVDLRDDKSACQSHVSYEDGRDLATMIKAVNYLECSALTGEGVKRVFDEAIRAVLPPVRRKKYLCCNLL